MRRNRKKRWSFSLATALILLMITLIGCTDEPPDTSAPERIEIDRTGDWQGALLYIADGNGPVEGWGSVRIYDNVSGFVEKTVEQTFAASPSDLFVTGDGSTMYVSSMANGLVDRFFWDGNDWRRGTREIETPSLSLFAMEQGPDGDLYLAGASTDSEAGAIYRLDLSTGDITQDITTFPEITQTRGIAWSEDGSKVYVTGPGPSGPRLVEADWPSASVTRITALHSASANQVTASPDGLVLYIACRGQVLLFDPSSGAVTDAIGPSSEDDTEYYDVAFSADGRYLFVPGTTPGGDSTLYIIDLDSGAEVHRVQHISKKANGIRRVE